MLAASVLLALLSPALRLAHAAACATVATCVALARRTPGEFTPLLQPLLLALPAAEKLRGLTFTDPNPRLQVHVRSLLLQQLSSQPPRALTPREVDVVAAQLAACPPDRRRDYLALFFGSPAGRAWLLARLRRSDGPPALAVEVALDLGWRALGGADRQRVNRLIWAQYLRERLALESAPTTPHVGHYIINHARDFAAPLRALLREAAARGQSLNVTDLRTHAVSRSEEVLRDLVAWAQDSRPAVSRPATLALLGWISNAGELRRAVASALVAVRAVVLRATQAPEPAARISAVSALRVLHEAVPDPELARRLVALAADGDLEVRRNAVSVLGAVARRPAPERPRALAALERALGDQRALVVRTAIAAVSELDATWLRPVLVRLLRRIPAARFQELEWQIAIRDAGALLERTTGQRYGFVVARQGPVGCGHGDLLRGAQRRTDLEIFGINNPAPPTPPPDPREAQRQLRSEGQRLLAARAKLPPGV